MQLITSDKSDTTTLLEGVLEGYPCPAILVSSHYEIIATNTLYQKQYGSVDLRTTHHCYEVSHGYKVPCDQAGEDCPLLAAQASQHKERVLHIHQTPRGKEHVDVELQPIYNQQNELVFFIELLRAIPLVSGPLTSTSMVGASKPFNKMLEKMARVGGTDASVLLLGESGTGKELAAKAIHIASKRKDQAMVTLECAGLTDSLFESELFGHVKGAFTGAHTNKKGLAEQANGGTLFLDEIGDIPLTIQVKLLRLLESGTFRPVGSTTVKTTDFRLICATHKNLGQMVDMDLFRQDLYYRINVFPIIIPNLMERANDIPLIAKSLLSQISPDVQYTLTESATSHLKQHVYKGNIRELRNLLNRAIILSDSEILDKKLIEESLESDSEKYIQNKILLNKQITKNITTPESLNNHDDLKTIETRYLAALMQEFNGDKKQVASIAGISVRSLYRKLQESHLP